MGWLRRSQAVDPIAEGGRVEATDDNEDPAVHDSPALTEIFAALDPERPVRVLDLGPALPTNLEFYAAISNGVRIVPLLRDDGLEGLRRLDGDAFAARLEHLLPLNGDGFGLILMWDLLNYLTEDQPACLARHLAAVSEDNARIHAMIISGETMPGEPSRYELLAGGRLRYRPTSRRRIDSPDPAPAQVERWLNPFRVERSILLRHGVREFIAIHG